MTPLSTGLKIWGITIFINAVYFGLFALITGDFFNAMLSLVILFVGAFIGIPFLILLVQLLKVARRLPHSTTARIFWVSFWVSAGVWLFYVAIAFIMEKAFNFFDPLVCQFAGITIAAFITSIWLCRRSLYEMYGMNEYSIN